jgi:hypothetical protein
VTINAPRQRNGVSEGMALGLVMLDCNDLTHDKLRIDLAFEHAWRDWPDSYKSQIRQVDTDLGKGKDAIGVMSHAGKDKRTFVFFWGDWDGRSFTIHRRRKDWDSGNPGDINDAVDSCRRHRAT